MIDGADMLVNDLASGVRKIVIEESKPITQPQTNMIAYYDSKNGRRRLLISRESVV